MHGIKKDTVFNYVIFKPRQHYYQHVYSESNNCSDKSNDKHNDPSVNVNSKAFLKKKIWYSLWQNNRRKIF